MLKAADTSAPEQTESLKELVDRNSTRLPLKISFNISGTLNNWESREITYIASKPLTTFDVPVVVDFFSNKCDYQFHLLKVSKLKKNVWQFKGTNSPLPMYEHVESELKSIAGKLNSENADVLIKYILTQSKLIDKAHFESILKLGYNLKLAITDKMTKAKSITYFYQPEGKDKIVHYRNYVPCIIENVNLDTEQEIKLFEEVKCKIENHATEKQQRLYKVNDQLNKIFPPECRQHKLYPKICDKSLMGFEGTAINFFIKYLYEQSEIIECLIHQLPPSAINEALNYVVADTEGLETILTILLDEFSPKPCSTSKVHNTPDDSQSVLFKSIKLGKASYLAIILEHLSLTEFELNAAFNYFISNADENDDVDMLVKLLAKGANPNFKAEREKGNSNTIFMRALFHKKHMCIEYMLNNCPVNLSIRNKNGDTAIHLALKCYTSKEKLVKADFKSVKANFELLLSKISDKESLISALNKDKKSALTISCSVRGCWIDEAILSELDGYFNESHVTPTPFHVRELFLFLNEALRLSPCSHIKKLYEFNVIRKIPFILSVDDQKVKFKSGAELFKSSSDIELGELVKTDGKIICLTESLAEKSKFERYFAMQDVILECDNIDFVCEFMRYQTQPQNYGVELNMLRKKNPDSIAYQLKESEFLKKQHEYIQKNKDNEKLKEILNAEKTDSDQKGNDDEFSD